MYTNSISQSRLFELARQGKRLTHVLAVIPLSLVLPFLAQFGSIPLVIMLGLSYGFSEDMLAMEGMPVTQSGLWMGLFLVTAFALLYLLVGLWVYFYEGRPFWTLGYERRDALIRYARGFLLGLLMFGASTGVLMAFGAASQQETADPARRGVAALGGVLLVLVGWIVQGGAEELVMRGWVLPGVGGRLRPWIGILLSSLLFAALHALNQHLSPLALVNLALFGVFAALYALREGSLWGISALHSSWNWIQGNLLGLQVSGTAFGGGTLVDLETHGPEWLSGGGFGPEGGVAVSAVLLIGMAAVLLWPRRLGSRLESES